MIKTSDVTPTLFSFSHTFKTRWSHARVSDTVFYVAGWHSATYTCAVLVAVATAIRGDNTVCQVPTFASYFRSSSL